MNPKYKPTNKVAASALTGSVVVVLTWILTLTGVDMPAPVGVAVATILSGLAGWFVPNAEA
jgi:hypothetical protein